MKLIYKSYKFKLNPNEEQQILLGKHFGCTRFVFNHFLNQRKVQYLNTKKSDNYFKQSASLTNLKKQEDTIWLKEINSQTLQYSLRCLDAAYTNFFKGNAQFPKFKSRRKKNTFTVPQSVRVINNELHIPKFKDGIKIKLHRELRGNIKHCTISKTPTGKYFVSILCEIEHIPLEKTGAIVGIDLGLKDFAITSDNIKYKNHRYTKKYARKLKRSQQHLSRKIKGSTQSEKQRLKVALLHEKISNIRKDDLHKISHQLISDYDIISLEDLNIKGMIKNHKLSKHIQDASWGTFVEYLTYKAAWNDKQIVKINRWYPSSKTCNKCGYINQNLTLKIREWKCPNCNTKLDRDYNAAINILNEGLKIITSAGTVDYTDGDTNKTSELLKHKSMKSEAQRL